MEYPEIRTFENPIRSDFKQDFKRTEAGGQPELTAIHKSMQADDVAAAVGRPALSSVLVLLFTAMCLVVYMHRLLSRFAVADARLKQHLDRLELLMQSETQHSDGQKKVREHGGEAKTASTRVSKTVQLRLLCSNLWGIKSDTLIQTQATIVDMPTLFPKSVTDNHHHSVVLELSLGPAFGR